MGLFRQIERSLPEFRMAYQWFPHLAEHGAEGLCVMEPLKEFESPLANWITQVPLDPALKPSNETLHPATRTFDISPLSLLVFCADSFWISSEAAPVSAGPAG